MPEIICGLGEILNPEKCNDRGGFRTAYWTEDANINWTAMLADPTLFDPANQQILGYSMNGAGVFNKLTFERKAAFYDFTYTRESDVYTLLISMLFKGKQLDRRNKLAAAVNCCNVVFHLYANDGTQRVVGRDYNGVVFDPLLDSLAISRHLDSSGQLGTSRSRDELDLGGESFLPPVFANVAEADIPLT